MSTTVTSKAEEETEDSKSDFQEPPQPTEAHCQLVKPAMSLWRACPDWGDPIKLLVMIQLSLLLKSNPLRKALFLNHDRKEEDNEEI